MIEQKRWHPLKTAVIGGLAVFFLLAALRVKHTRNITTKKMIKGMTNSFGPMDGYFLSPNSEMCIELEQTGKKFQMERESDFSSTWYKQISGELDHPGASRGSIRIVLPDDSLHVCNRFELQPASPSGDRVMHLIRPDGTPWEMSWKKVPFAKCQMTKKVPGRIDVKTERDPNLVVTKEMADFINGGWSDCGTPNVIFCSRRQKRIFDLHVQGMTRAFVRSATCEITRIDKDGNYLGVIQGSTRIGGELNYRVKFYPQQKRLIFQNVDWTDIGSEFLKKAVDNEAACPKREL